MTEAPFITTGTVIVSGPEAPAGDDDGTALDSGIVGSRGRELKNFSSFLDSSVLLCLTHPTIPFLAFTKYHLAPSPTNVSAKGEISSPGFKVDTMGEDSSGAVNSCISPVVGRKSGTLAACDCLQITRSSNAVKIRTALNFVKIASAECFHR